MEEDHIGRVTCIWLQYLKLNQKNNLCGHEMLAILGFD